MNEKKLTVSLIVARTLNHIIGRENAMPWHLPVDLAWFRQHTLGKPVIMGRKTYESIGRLLPKRPNIILSRHHLEIEGAYSATSLEQALDIARKMANADEVMIIGGGELYKQALPLANRLYLTEIQTELDGDTVFSPDLSDWQLISESHTQADNENAYACHFMRWERKSRF